jgi:hypothetical protein
MQQRFALDSNSRFVGKDTLPFIVPIGSLACSQDPPLDRILKPMN